MGGITPPMKIHQNDAAKPGDLILRSGASAPPDHRNDFLPCGAIRFQLGDGTEVMRIEAGGKVLVNGESVEAPQQIFEHFFQWLQTSMIRPSEVDERPSFAKELERLLNSHSMDVASHTPDFVLSTYLRDCLGAWNKATVHRDRWYVERRQPPVLETNDKENP